MVRRAGLAGWLAGDGREDVVVDVPVNVRPNDNAGLGLRHQVGRYSSDRRELSCEGL